MHIILYNPLSRNGKNIKLVKKLEQKLIKKNIDVISKNILEISNPKQFIMDTSTLDSFIIVGGDGTLNRLINAIGDVNNIKQNIFMYKAGTGNDFLRSITKKKGLVNIKQYLQSLPVVTIKDKKINMLNGVGLGLDGLVCYKVNNSRLKKNKYNYFKHAISAFKDYTPKISTISADNNKFFVEKTWFVSVMNSQYFGGGMKIAPKASRQSEYLDLVIISKIPRWLLIFIFPSIYLGLHTIFKKYVKIVKVKEVEIEFIDDSIMQIDGEDFSNIKKIHVIKK